MQQQQPIPTAIPGVECDEFASTALSTQAEVLRLEVATLYRELIAALAGQQQRVVEMRFSLEMTASEIAKELQITAVAVSAIEGRAMASLKRMLAARGIRRVSDIF